MAIRRYIVTEPSTLEALRQEVRDADRDETPLMVTASPVSDELSQRRGPATPETFTFQVTDIHTDPDDYSVLVQNKDTGKWSTIIAKDGTISFSVVS